MRGTVQRWFVSGGGKHINVASTLVASLQARPTEFAPNASQLRSDIAEKDKRAATDAADARRLSYLSSINAAEFSRDVRNVMKQAADDRLLTSSAKSEIASVGARVRDTLANNENLKAARDAENKKKAGVSTGGGGGGGAILAALAAGAALLFS
jgi:hypothetical protein